jgi:hypothetical protein
MSLPGHSDFDVVERAPELQLRQRHEQGASIFEEQEARPHQRGGKVGVCTDMERFRCADAGISAPQSPGIRCRLAGAVSSLAPGWRGGVMSCRVGTCRQVTRARVSHHRLHSQQRDQQSLAKVPATGIGGYG